MAEMIANKGEKVAFLYIQNACLAATQRENCNILKEKKIDQYALRADCEARGLLGKVDANVKIIEYIEWVDLVMNEHDKIVSWT
jgi:sulfur relay protein TusB/DsrH